MAMEQSLAQTQATQAGGMKDIAMANAQGGVI
jgi:hypothetical protein